MRAMDVEKAFLQSAETDRKVYVFPPEEAEHPLNTVWQLFRPAYGLNDAARGWHRTLLNLGLTESVNEEAMFLHKENVNLDGLIVAHVDDLLVSGNDKFYSVIEEVKKYIKLGKEQNNNFKFCGMSLYMSGIFEITVGVETSKVNCIQKLTTTNEKLQLTAEEENLVRSRIGTFKWFATLTRPDLCIDLSRALSHLNKERDT